jgi:hypothetical protein
METASLDSSLQNRSNAMRHGSPLVCAHRLPHLARRHAAHEVHAMTWTIPVVPVDTLAPGKYSHSPGLFGKGDTSPFIHGSHFSAGYNQHHGRR